MMVSTCVFWPVVLCQLRDAAVNEKSPAGAGYVLLNAPLDVLFQPVTLIVPLIYGVVNDPVVSSSNRQLTPPALSTIRCPAGNAVLAVHAESPEFVLATFFQVTPPSVTVVVPEVGLLVNGLEPPDFPETVTCQIFVCPPNCVSITAPANEKKVEAFHAAVEVPTTTVGVPETPAVLRMLIPQFSMGLPRFIHSAVPSMVLPPWKRLAELGTVVLQVGTLPPVTGCPPEASVRCAVSPADA